MLGILNLKEFNPWAQMSHGIGSSIITFNGGEQHIKIHPIYGKRQIVIVTQVQNSKDIMNIVLAKNALDKMFVKDVSLFIPYMPYARQDRVCEVGESLSIEAFAGIINMLNFNKVVTLDVHSDVTLAVIKNCINMPITDFFFKVLKQVGDDVTVIFPDYGAQKRYKYLSVPSIACSKERDTADGSLSNFKVNGDIKEGSSCLIIDDICDGGRTFHGIGKALKDKGAGDLYLYTTHGIYSASTTYLKPYYKRVFCTDSFKTIEDDDFFKQIKIRNIDDYFN